MNKEEEILEKLAEEWIIPVSQIPITMPEYKTSLISFGNTLLKKIKENKKYKPKEPTLFRVELLLDGFGNCEGDILLVKEIDTALNVYYYDCFRRWCYATVGEYMVVKNKKNMEKYNNVIANLNRHPK